MQQHFSSRRARGFTMIELVIVMAMLGLLLSLALPHYMATLERGREQVLQSNLATMREAIDKYYGDRGRYPDKLEDLVTQRYLRAIPNDPYLEAPTWVVIAPRDADKGGVIDVRSTLTDIDGQPRRAAAAPTDNEPVSGLERDAGSSSVVTATGAEPAASAATTGTAP